MRFAIPVTLLALLAACLSPRARAGGEGARADECAIHAAAIDSIFARRGVGAIVLLDSTASETAPATSGAERRELAGITGHDSALVADFTSRNADPRAVCPDLRPGPSLDVTRVRAADLATLPRRDADSYWTAFHERYPRARGTLTLSRPGISTDGSRAVLEMRYLCGSLCGEGMLVLLHRDGDRWRVVSKRTMWVS